jgi:hypothetical protein
VAESRNRLVHHLELLDGDRQVVSLQTRDWPALFSLQNLKSNHLYRVRMIAIDADKGKRGSAFVLTGRTARHLHSLLSTNSMANDELGKSGKRSSQQQFRLDRVSGKQSLDEQFVPTSAWFGLQSRLLLLCLLSGCCLVLLVALFVLILVRVRNKRLLDRRESSLTLSKQSSSTSGQATSKKSTDKFAALNMNTLESIDSQTKSIVTTLPGKGAASRKCKKSNLSHTLESVKMHSKSKQPLLDGSDKYDAIVSEMVHSTSGYFSTGEYMPNSAHLLHLESRADFENATLSLNPSIGGKRSTFQRIRFAPNSADHHSDCSQLIGHTKQNPDVILNATEGTKKKFSFGPSCDFWLI